MPTTRHHTHIDLERLTGIRERRVSVGDEDPYVVGISIHDIDHVITRQPSAREIRKDMAKMAAAFGDTPRHDAVITVGRYGNTGSTTHTVALVEELEAEHIRPGATVAMTAWPRRLARSSQPPSHRGQGGPRLPQ